jgi:hypothetical protein
VLKPAEVIAVHYIYNSELIGFRPPAGNRNSLVRGLKKERAISTTERG